MKNKKCKSISKINETSTIVHTHTHVILKSNNAITLISLVITIIILLILAGVSLNLVVGEDGIVKQTMDSRNSHEDAQNKEQIQLAVMSSIGTDLHIDLDKLKTEIENIGGTVTGATFPVIAKKERTEVVINEIGEISDLEKITEVENLPDSWEPAYSSNAGNDWYAYKDADGKTAKVNAPKLADGMTAIKYVQGTNTDTETNTDTDTEEAQTTEKKARSTSTESEEVDTTQETNKSGDVVDKSDKVEESETDGQKLWQAQSQGLQSGNDRTI